METGSGRSEYDDPEVHPGVLGLSEPVTEEVSLNLRPVTAHRHWSISRGKGLHGCLLLKLPLNLPPQKVDSFLVERNLKDLWDAFMWIEPHRICVYCICSEEFTSDNALFSAYIAII